MSRMPPPSAMASPAAVAEAAPHAPSASPLPAAPFAASVIAAVSVDTAKSPEPSPIRPAPKKNNPGACIGAAKITVAKAASPITSPLPAMR